jgi:hypothetical protein
MTEESEPKLPSSGSDFLEQIKARHPDLPELWQMSPSDIVGYIKDRYLKPNWLHWRNMAEVSLQQAVWLSLNIESWKDDADVNDAIEGISKRPAAVMQRSIRALAVMANLIDQQGNVVSGAAGKVLHRLEHLRFRSPRERSVRDLLNEAASLEPDAE